MSFGNGNGTVRAVADSPYLRAGANIVSVASGPIVVGLLVFLVGLRTDVTALQGDIRRIDSELQLRTQSRYTSEDAKRDRATVDLRFDELERRVNHLDGNK